MISLLTNKKKSPKRLEIVGLYFLKEFVMKSHALWVGAVIVGMLVCAAFLRKEYDSLAKENIALKQQLELARASAGQPIKLVDLPAGSYRRADNLPGIALVQRVCDPPEQGVGRLPIAVMRGLYIEVPQQFAIGVIHGEHTLMPSK